MKLIIDGISAWGRRSYVEKKSTEISEDSRADLDGSDAYRMQPGEEARSDRSR